MSWRLTIPVAIALACPPLLAQAQPLVPVNLYAARIEWVGGSPRIGTPRKLTGDRGISSQPAYTPDGKSILFIGRRDSANAQSDVYRIDLATGAETRITATPENENSPTVTPDGRLMVIRWIPATLFREWGPWVYEMDGRPSKGVLPGPDTVGYYVRLDSVTFAMMRPKSRPAVSIFDSRSGTMIDHDWPVATLPPQIIPRARAISYTRTDSLGRNMIRRLDLATKKTSDIAPTVLGRTVHAWTPSGTLLMGKGNRVFALDPARGAVWREVAVFSDPELQSVTTYVVSPAGNEVILISPVKPPLHTELRDRLQSGSSVSAAIAAVRRSESNTMAQRYEISAAALTSLAVEHARRGRGEDAAAIVALVAELSPQDAERARQAVAEAQRK